MVASRATQGSRSICHVTSTPNGQIDRRVKAIAAHHHNKRRAGRRGPPFHSTLASLEALPTVAIIGVVLVPRGIWKIAGRRGRRNDHREGGDRQRKRNRNPTEHGVVSYAAVIAVTTAAPEIDGDAECARAVSHKSQAIGCLRRRSRWRRAGSASE